MPANDIMELTVDQTYAGQNITNVHHFQQLGPDGTDIWQIALKSIWTALFEPAFLAMVIDTLEVIQIKLRRLLPIQTQQSIFARGTFGTIAGDGLPPHAATLVRQYGEGADRKGTGGSKIAGVPEAAIEEGRISAAQAALMVTWGDLAEVDHTDGVTGYTFRSGVFRPADGTIKKIIKSFATPRIITVRSRQIGVGQ